MGIWIGIHERDQPMVTLSQCGFLPPFPVLLSTKATLPTDPEQWVIWEGLLSGSALSGSLIPVGRTPIRSPSLMGPGFDLWILVRLRSSLKCSSVLLLSLVWTSKYPLGKTWPHTSLASCYVLL